MSITNHNRFGLCCIFKEAPIKFRQTTATAVLKLNRKERLEKLSAISLHNASTLLTALEYCAAHNIGSFRILSQILPLKTHPEAGYEITRLPDHEKIIALFRKCRQFAREQNIRLTFHPDQFIVLNSPRKEVVANAIKELDYQAEVAGWVGADVINIHVGGAYGDKRKALDSLKKNLDLLPKPVRKIITIENDDKLFTPADILPLCREEKIPFVYDVHHHRCNPDNLSVEEATQQALSTWNREPLFHISSPLDGWNGPKPYRHQDYINIDDFPLLWQNLDITIEVEAKAKELAIKKLQNDLARRYKKHEILT
jgi:UV DNA damage endonuclease